MNRLAILVFVSFLMLIITSCEKDEVTYPFGDFRIDWVTARSDNGNSAAYFQRDDGVRLYVDENQSFGFTDARYLLNYVITEGDNLSRKIRVNSCSRIDCFDVLTADESSLPEFPNDKLKIESLWLSGNSDTGYYLNIRYISDASWVFPAIGLIYAGEETDKLILHLRFDRRSQPPGYDRKGYVSFRLKNLVNGIDDVYVEINSTNYGTGYFVISSEEGKEGGSYFIETLPD